MLPLIMHVVLCLGIPESEISKIVDKSRAINPRVTIIVTQVRCEGVRQ